MDDRLTAEIGGFMYKYEDSSTQQYRKPRGECRCGSKGAVYNLAALVQKGVIFEPTRMLNPLSTPQVSKSPSAPKPEGSGYGKTYIFAVSENLDIHVAPDSERRMPDAVKHETLFHNAHVLAAGEICIQDGVIVDLNDQSGSYGTLGALETNPQFADAILRAIKKHSLPIDQQLNDRLEQLRNS